MASPSTSSSKPGSSLSQPSIHPINPVLTISPPLCTYRTSASLPYHPYLSLPPSNPEALWRDGPHSFNCGSPDLKGGGRTARCSPGAAQQSVRSGLFPNSTPQVLQGGQGGEEVWSSELASEMHEGGYGAAREKLLLLAFIIPKPLSPHSIPSPSRPLDSICTTTVVKNLSPRITKNSDT